MLLTTLHCISSQKTNIQTKQKKKEKRKSQKKRKQKKRQSTNNVINEKKTQSEWIVSKSNRHTPAT